MEKRFKVGNSIRRDKSAVAITYERPAPHAKRAAVPEIASRGQRAFAKEIIKRARRYGVPQVQDRTLTNQLMAIEEGEQIPPSLYDPLARILVSLERRRKKP